MPGLQQIENQKSANLRKESQQMDSELLETLLCKVLQTADDAAEVIMEVYRGSNFETSYKDDDSPLTRADSRAHELIAGDLSRLSPRFPVISEEDRLPAYQTRKAWQSHWLIDPLDGTKEFVKKNDEFTVNIALIHQGIPVLGVVVAPALKWKYWAVQGLGAFRSDEGLEAVPIRVSDYTKDEGLRIVASRSHARERVQKLLDAARPVEIIHIGSSLKICFVAEGKAHLYPRLGPTMEWDTAAAHCILNEAGGTLTDIYGEPLHYNKENLRNPEFIATGCPSYPWKQVLDREGGRDSDNGRGKLC